MPKPPLQDRFLAILSVAAPCMFFSACASVDTILLTSGKYPPKRSARDVAVLEHTPAQPHLDLAELRIGDSWPSF